jgi:hypothetical protein
VSNDRRKRSPIDPRRSWVGPLLAAITVIAWRVFIPGDNEAHWMLIARDSSYAISLDTSRIARLFDRGYDIWYRTDHVATRFYREKAFNREIVRAEIACRDLAFKVVSTTMSMRGAGTVERQVNSREDVQRERWHRVEPGSTEADAARATCIVADSRWRGR